MRSSTLHRADAAARPRIQPRSGRRGLPVAGPQRRRSVPPPAAGPSHRMVHARSGHHGRIQRAEPSGRCLRGRRVGFLGSAVRRPHAAPQGEHLPEGAGRTRQDARGDDGRPCHRPLFGAGPRLSDRDCRWAGAGEAVTCLVVSAGSADLGEAVEAAEDVGRTVGRALQAVLRGSDAVGRVSALDFMVIAPGMTPESAAPLVERFSGAVAALRPASAAPIPLRVRVVPLDETRVAGGSGATDVPAGQRQSKPGARSQRDGVFHPLRLTAVEV
jgi:hypothetical protein